MTKLFQTFRNQEDGNSSLDWIILTAGILMLSTAMMASIIGNSGDLARDDATQPINYPVTTAL